MSVLDNHDVESKLENLVTPDTTLPELQGLKDLAKQQLSLMDREVVFKLVALVYFCVTASVSREGEVLGVEASPFEREVLRKFMKSVFKHASLPEDAKYENHIAISSFEEYIAKYQEANDKGIQNEELLKEMAPFENAKAEVDVREYLTRAY